MKCETIQEGRFAGTSSRCLVVGLDARRAAFVERLRSYWGLCDNDVIRRALDIAWDIVEAERETYKVG